MEDDALSVQTQELRYEALIEIETADLYMTGITSVDIDKLFTLEPIIKELTTESGFHIPLSIEPLIEKVKMGITMTPSKVYNELYEHFSTANGTLCFYMFTGNDGPLRNYILQCDPDTEEFIDIIMKYMEKKRLKAERVLNVLLEFYTAHIGIDFATEAK